jgi:hypothetical protein
MPTAGFDNCHTCRHFVDDPQELEDSLPGLTILSSAWGSTRGDAGLCASHGTWQDPETGCPDYLPKLPQTFPESTERVTSR